MWRSTCSTRCSFNRSSLFFDAENRWAFPIEVYVLYGDVSTPNNWTLRYHSCENFFVHSNYETSTACVRSPFDIAVIKLVDEVQLRKQQTILPLCRHDDRMTELSRETCMALPLDLASPI